LANLAAGTYTVTVTDANGCQDSISVIITQPAVVTPSVTVVDANCGQSDGSATASTTGGTGLYTYLWDDPAAQTSGTATGLPAGTYTVIVTDQNGCTGTASGTVANIPGGTATAVIDNNTSGFNICDGQATVTISGGTAPFTYLWNDPAAQSTATAANLCDGSYCVTITDANGCVATDCITITEPGAVVLTLTPTDILCFGDCNGSIDLTVSGGIQPYTFSWTPGGMTAQNITNQCAGTYTVTVTDSNGIITAGSAAINQPLAPLTATVAGTDILCNGDSAGTVNMTVTGGTAPYLYLWDDPAASTTEDIANLPVGTYTATVTDTNGCTTTTSYTVTGPTALTLNTAGNPANCGQPDGDVTVFPTGGTGAYTYNWDDPSLQTTATAAGLAAGTYNVTVTDANGCTQTASQGISDLGGGTASVVTDINASCAGACDGQLTVSIIGGTAPYTYSWDDPGLQATATATGLCAGTFNVTITDGVGCIATASGVISEPVALTATTAMTPAICNGACDGTATANPAGGTLPYTYSWDDPGLQTTATATGLCATTYNVIITDINGCSVTQGITITEPVAITVATSSVNSNCGQADGATTASASNGTAPYTYLWDDPALQTTQTATDLLAGGYIVNVTDANGCTGSATVTVSDSAGPTASIPVANIFPVTCPGGNDGELTVAVTDGMPPYTYLWDDPAAQTNATADSLTAGTYSVIVTDSNGCISSVSAVIVEPAALIAAITNSTNLSCNASCDGTASVGATGGTSPYTFLWADGQTTVTATGLCAITLGVTVTDANGCQDSAVVSLTEPVILSLSTSTTDASCLGICDGTATNVPAGGTPPYTYSWNDPGSQTTATANGLCAGTYITQVTDANGCVVSSTVIISEPIVLGSSIIQTVGVDCFGDCDGIAEVDATGGTAPYTYLWSDGQSTPLAINLCAGTYTVNITDANGCTTVNTVTITQPAALTNVFSSTDVDCNGNATGVATANITGGTPPFTYLWDDPGFQTNASATGLVAGIYCVQITDANGCVLTECITINEPVAIAIVIDTTGANCGLADGAACVTVSSGIAPFTYLWDDPSNQTTPCAVGIASGIYNITVTDNTGCTALGLAVVSDLGAPTLLISSQNDVSCNSGCDGFATVLITNGLAPYTYNWNDPNAQTTALASGLCAGTYVVAILDSNGCTGNISAVINEPTALGVIISGQTPVTCNGDCDGTATGLASGGTAPYTYQWNDSGTQTTATANGLCAGSYGLTVIDANGCTDTTSVTIVQPDIIALTISGDDAHCGLADGTASVTAIGGNGLYGYLWDDPASQNTATASNLLAGTYMVVVTDILGCTQSISVTINDLPAGVATISTAINVSCNGGSDGAATVSMSGGQVPFTYNWNDPLAQTNSTATALLAGTYIVNVTDSFGCVVPATVVITDPPVLTLTTTADSVTCNGICDGSASVNGFGGTPPFNYLWDDPLAQTNEMATGLCLGTYNVTITDARGCFTTTTQAVDQPPSIVLTESHSDANCGQPDGIATVTVTGGTFPYTYLWSNGANTAFITNVFAGTYIITVTDVNGCTQSLSITIADLAGPVATITASDSVSCFGGNDGWATAGVTGGTFPYQYQWDDLLNQITPTATNLTAGVYTVTIRDLNNCVASASVTIYEPPAIVFNSSSSDPVCFNSCDGSGLVTVSGGTPLYTYLWDDPGTQTTATALGLCAGSYNLVITDANGCIELTSVTLTNPAPMTVGTTGLDETCLSLCDGSATAIPSNGIQPYTYSWDDVNNQATVTAASLCAGTYNVVLTDANGCTASTFATIGSPPLLVTAIASSGNVSCFGFCDGFAQSTTNGGTPPYAYLWDDGQSAGQAIGLCAGVYNLLVTDANGCTATTNVTITEPQGMVVTT
ncbi:MAG: SprB repeat-containing protein, partial [Flavobacteriales bacterium]|nr:SprB repeat-containing protein [Flavobacteriales bacterium]